VVVKGKSGIKKLEIVKLWKNAMCLKGCEKMWGGIELGPKWN